MEPLTDDSEDAMRDIMNSIKEAHYAPEEARQIREFLGRGFSRNSQVVIASIFTFAKQHRESISAAEILRACEERWEAHWKFQDPRIRGDPDAPGGAGIKNRQALESVYSAIDVPCPANKKKTEIPAEAFMVTTLNSIYRFGKADQKGERTVSRDGRPLDFTQCKILHLAIGESMTIEGLDGSHSSWYTTSVRSIE